MSHFSIPKWYLSTCGLWHTLGAICSHQCEAVRMRISIGFEYLYGRDFLAGKKLQTQRGVQASLGLVSRVTVSWAVRLKRKLEKRQQSNKHCNWCGEKGALGESVGFPVNLPLTWLLVLQSGSQNKIADTGYVSYTSMVGNIYLTKC